MEVEVFSIDHDETPITAEMDAEAIELIEKLGLEGQKTLISKNTQEVETLHRNPWPTMMDEELQIYKILCPSHHRLEKFANESIPLKVLKEIALAKELELFGRIEIWTSKPAIDDPIVLGFEQKDEYKSGKIWKIARWGRELYTLAELNVIAMKEKRDELLNSLTKIATEVKVAIDTVKSPDFTNMKATVSAYIHID